MFWLAFWTPEPDYGKVMGCLCNRRIFKTRKGYLGIGCYDAKEGNMVAVCKGGRIPLVVRKEGLTWRVVGDCHLHGIMKGEMFDEKKCGDMWFV